METKVLMKKSLLALSIISALGLSACDNDVAKIRDAVDDATNVAGDGGTRPDPNSDSSDSGSGDSGSGSSGSGGSGSGDSGSGDSGSGDSGSGDSGSGDSGSGDSGSGGSGDSGSGDSGSGDSGSGDSGSGGSGDSGSGNSGSGTTTPTSIGGTAAKGLINNGIITAYELDTHGNRIRTLGSSVVSSGAYNIPMPANYAGGPILLSLTATADTTMVCDVQTACNNYFGSNQYGQSVRVDPNMEMYAVLSQAQNNVINAVNITPFTHMAAARALNEGTVDSLAVNRANREVSLILGRDILSAPFVDVTKANLLASASSDQKLHAAFVAGMSRFLLGHGRNAGGVAGNQNQLLDIKTGLDLLWEAYKDGRFDADDVAHGTGLKLILEDIRLEAVEAGLLTSAVDSQINAVRAQIGLDNIWTPDLNLDPNASLQKGKDVVDAENFIDALEAWKRKINQADTDFLAWQGDPAGLTGTGFRKAQRLFNANVAEMSLGIPGGNPANYRNIIAHIVQYIHNTPVTSAAVDQPGEVVTRTVQITDPAALPPAPSIGSVEIKISENASHGLTFKIKNKSGLGGLKVDLVIETDLPIEMLDSLAGPVPAQTLTISGAKLTVSGELANANRSTVLNMDNLLYQYTLNPALVLDGDPATPAPSPRDTLEALLLRPMNVGADLNGNPDMTSAMYKGNVVMTQIVNDDLIVGKTVTYTYDSNVDVELVPLHDLTGITVYDRDPSGRKTSLKKADYSGALKDDTGRSIKVERKLDIRNAADFDTFDYRTGRTLSALSFPEINRLRPNFNLPGDSVRLIDQTRLAPDESATYFLDGSLSVMRDLITNDVSTNFGILNAKASSDFNRTGFRSATSAITLISDNNNLSLTGDLVRDAAGAWAFKKVAPNGPGGVLPTGSTYVIQNTEGAKLTLAEVAGTNNAGDPELKIHGTVTVDGRIVAQVQEQADGRFTITFEDGDDRPDFDLAEITRLIQSLLLSTLAP